MSGALKPSLALHQIAMVSVHSCPLAPWEIGNTFVPPRDSPHFPAAAWLKKMSAAVPFKPTFKG